MEKTKIVENVAFNILKQAVIYLPDDVKQALKKAYAEETSEVGNTQLKAILDNIELAEKYQAPVCQDTGTIIFYIKAGSKAKDLDKIEEALVNAVRKATKEIPLRPNAVDPFTQKNSGDNTGRFIPHVNWEIVPGDSIELTVMTKGGGSENVCVTGMLVPGEGIKGLKRFVIDAVIKAGAQPCPPTILGIAMGGGADISMKLAKKALLKPLNEPNSNPEIAKLEKEIFEAANMTGIGPMGLGGKTTVLGVHIDYAFRHPASFPAAVAFNCWAARRASARINADGTVEYLTHKLK
ncbi:MAG: fumarate hydratase [Candidatus Bathyarchaeota archaeon]|jgi:fumarate hydratase subunit alpha|nr:fumarate hydratase [Candidatus Bathyarchaeota archaeon A05DMB-5]MDH7558481.1 fumarate hydratase [Candidatus Bathyarchaeota archaeon]